MKVISTIFIVIFIISIIYTMSEKDDKHHTDGSPGVVILPFLIMAGGCYVMIYFNSFLYFIFNFCSFLFKIKINKKYNDDKTNEYIQNLFIKQIYFSNVFLFSIILGIIGLIFKSIKDLTIAQTILGILYLLIESFLQT